MTQEIVERIIDETVDTIIDSIDEKTVDYMFEYGNYEETDNEFFDDKEELFVKVITELNNRIKNEEALLNTRPDLVSQTMTPAQQQQIDFQRQLQSGIGTVIINALNKGSR